MPEANLTHVEQSLFFENIVYLMQFCLFFAFIPTVFKYLQRDGISMSTALDKEAISAGMPEVRANVKCFGYVRILQIM